MQDRVWEGGKDGRVGDRLVEGGHGPTGVGELPSLAVVFWHVCFAIVGSAHIFFASHYAGEMCI